VKGDRELGRFRDIQIDDYRLLAAPDDNRFNGFIGAGIQFLMWNVRRHVNEIAGAGFFGEFEMVTPAEEGVAFHDVQDRLDFAVVVGCGTGGGFDDHGPSPEFIGTGAGMSDGSGTGHAGSLGRVAIQFTGAHDADTGGFPVGHLLSSVAPKERRLLPAVQDEVAAKIEEHVQRSRYHAPLKTDAISVYRSSRCRPGVVKRSPVAVLLPKPGSDWQERSRQFEVIQIVAPGQRHLDKKY
jgi:hypothetical protein